MSSSVSKMRVITTIAEAQAQPYVKRRVLVPTMGALQRRMEKCSVSHANMLATMAK
jgi:hypothetical protein